jgi:hypothetical protein
MQAARDVPNEKSGPIVFIQPFSIGSAGGGARILRALLEDAPLPWRSIASSPEKPKSWRDEIHLPSRPFWGRIEHSRLAAISQSSARFFTRRFRERLKDRCLQLGARAIHAVPHAGLDFAEAQTVARELSVPFFISLHDDLAYTAFGHGGASRREEAMAHAWNEAAARFVISDVLGREYSRRYGTREFQIVTDGVPRLGAEPVAVNGTALRIYFMGLFHMGYERNLRALLEAIALFQRSRPETTVSVTLRCEHVRREVLAGMPDVTIQPFADEAQVQRDIEQADLLYMPIPFGEEHERFARYSLSTKMVTYVGSGVPILYHGPATSAAYHLLHKHQAAIPVTTLNPEEIAAILAELTAEQRSTTAANALELARREFMLADQMRKFWEPILQCLTSR